MKTVIALLTSLALLATTTSVFAGNEEIPSLVETEIIEINEADEPIATDELDIPVEVDVLAENEAADDTAVEVTASDVAVLAQTTTVDTYDALVAAVAAANPGDTIQLTADITTAEYLTTTKTLTLDLNGCTLTSTNKNTAIYVNGGDLTIIDTKGNGKVLNTVKYSLWLKAGSITLESGTVETSAKNYAVNAVAGTAMTINGGVIKSGHSGIKTPGTLTINGGTITAPNFGVVAGAGSKTTMSDGLVKSKNGFHNSGTFIMSGGTIEGGSTNGPGINNAANGKLTINGGTVTGYYSIWANANCEITINKGTVKSDSKYGVYAKAVPFTLNVNGGEIIAGSVGIYTCENDAGNGAAAKITIDGGTVNGTADSASAVRLMKEAELTIKSGTLYGGYEGVIAKPNSTIIMDGGDVITTGEGYEGTDYQGNPVFNQPYGIYSQGNVIINGGSIISEKGTAFAGNANYPDTDFTINNGTLSGIIGIYHPQKGKMTINGGTITANLTGMEVRGGEVTVNGGTIISNAKELVSEGTMSGATTLGAGISVVQHPGRTVPIKFTVTSGEIIGFVPLFEANIEGNKPEDIAMVDVIVTGGTFTNTNLDDPNHESVHVEDVDHFMTGGIYSSKIPYEYIDDEYYRRDLHDGANFEVTKPKFTVIESARTNDAEIDLVDLRGNEGIDEEPFSTFRVVIDKALDEDVQAITAVKEAQNDVNAKLSAFDITVEKTDDAGKTTNITDGIFEQEVLITLLNAPTPLENVNVYYIDKNQNIAMVETEITVVDDTVAFVAPELSTYAITYNPIEVTADKITNNVGVVFEPVGVSGNQYYINLIPLDEGTVINSYMSSDIAFKIENVNPGDRVIYEIEPADNMNATLLKERGDSREYHFEMDGVNENERDGKKITIGTITFKGYGEFNFSVDTEFVTAEGHTVNIVNTQQPANNIVAHYSYADIVGFGKLIVNEALDTTYKAMLEADESGTIHETFTPDKATLTVNVAFNNFVVTKNPSEYQDMTLTISGGHLGNDIVIKLGDDSVVEAGTSVTFGEKPNSYKVVISDTLLRNVLYSVKLEGAGYRTAYCTVMMTNSKTLNFWNNVMDEPAFIEEGNTTSNKVTKNFLAGDIVDDKNINIYDLSAVVSYFGSASTTENGYAKYDLNRDGVIDSKDVAYVLASWND